MKNSQKGFAHLGIIILIVVLGVIGAAGYYVYNSSKDDKQTTQSTDTKTVSSATESSTAASTTAETKSTIKPTYTPENLFTESEKTELDKKLIQPNIDYAEQYKDKEGYDPVISITVTKKTDAEYASQPEYSKYRYTVDVVSKNGTKTGFLYAEKDVIDWWLPECFNGQCGLNDAFKVKYPEIVTKLKAQGNTP